MRIDFAVWHIYYLYRNDIVEWSSFVNISRKCQYALLAVYELARRFGQGPIKIADIARRHNIPLKFLELILNELKQGGFVESRRGLQGGYLLALRPADLSVGAIVRHIEGSPDIVQRGQDSKLRQESVFNNLWREVKTAIETIFDDKSFQDLLEESFRERGHYVPDYTI